VSRLIALTGGNVDRNFEFFLYDVPSSTFTQITNMDDGERWLLIQL